MFGPQFVDERPYRRGEPLVDRGDVDELRVPAVGRDRLGAQDRMRRRIDQRRDVGVPAWPVRALLLSVSGAISVVIGRGRNGMDLRETRWSGVTFVRMTGSHLAELRTERDLRRVIERLVAEEHDLPLVQRGADCAHLVGRQRRRQVHSADQRSGPAGQRCHLKTGIGCSGHHHAPSKAIANIDFSTLARLRA